MLLVVESVKLFLVIKAQGKGEGVDRMLAVTKNANRGKTDTQFMDQEP